MKKSLIALLSFAVALGGFGVVTMAMTSRAQAQLAYPGTGRNSVSAATYKVIAMPASNDAAEEELNSLSREGWELVEVVGDGGSDTRLILRRPAR